MSSVARFGIFEADLNSSQLRKQGRLIRLQQQPFDLLKALLNRPGEIVTRDELRSQLWPADVVVDFDQALNKCVTKLREALGDSAASPRFIETVPRRGYRFIAAAVTVDEIPPAPPTPNEVEVAVPVSYSTWRVQTLIPVAIMIGLVGALLRFGAQPHEPPQQSAPALAGIATANQVGTETVLRGQFALSRRSEGSLRNAVGLFESAIARNPADSAAYVGLANAWSLLSTYGAEEPTRAMARSRQFANRALALDPRSAEAHASLGRTTMLVDWDWTTAESHFKKAIALQPRDATAHQWYAYLLSATARHDEAEREARRSADLEPLALSAATTIGYVLYAARRFDDAAIALRRVIDVDPDFMQARKNLGLVRAAQRRFDDAIPEFERVLRLSGDSAVAQADLAWARGLAGDWQAAQRLVRELEAKQARGYVPLESLSLALLGAGEPARAVAALKSAFARREPGLARLAVDPRWDALLEDPQVQKLARTIRGGGRP